VITGEDDNGWGVVGAHAAHYNHGSCGICLIGDFELAAPTDAALTSLAWLIAWKAGRNGIDALHDDLYENYYGRFFDFQNISGHRDVGFTACPGTLLSGALPAVRVQAAKQAGRFAAVTAATSALVRNDRGPGALPAASAPLVAAPPTNPPTSTTSPTGADAATRSAPAKPTTVPVPAGSRLVGYRVLTANGTVMNTAHAPNRGNPNIDVIGLSAPGTGDGYAAVAASGLVLTYGNVTAAGTAVGKGSATAIATTRTGQGYWVLMADGGIYPFGDARYFGSPKRRGTKTRSVAIHPAPLDTGYWVLGLDGSVRAFGSATSMGAAHGPDTPVGLAASASGDGVLVLFDSGRVAALGNATTAGDLAGVTSRWSHPAVAIVSAPFGDGYVISSRDGGLFSFAGAPVLGSFAGSGATAVGLAVACG
jgi:hypothetical protein